MALHLHPNHRCRGSATPPPHLVSYIDNAIRAAYKDPVGRRDFALAADGGRISPKLTSSFDSSPVSPPRRPENILDEDLRSGVCWLFPGDHGQVGIKIPQFIHPTHFTIDHIPHEIAADIRQAPRELVLWGVVDGSPNWRVYKDVRDSLQQSLLDAAGDAPPMVADKATFLPLAVVEYNIRKDFHIQTFPLHPAITSTQMYFGAFVLEVRSNWGGSVTKVYRVRIHGEEVYASS
ncbi:hypothetical protein OH76DRAFT_1454732 [Lentinus brumalis]|uniref:SUN domain-containing protein n=1 Tax=Lentinus brumalis TaxID=2498619 RepID=A0A371DH19_9APHY|nr:hypothetical protein OH76DRAFT_1454732 [Polyporus brumalis]